MRGIVLAGVGIAAAAALFALGSPMIRPRCSPVIGGPTIDIPLSKLIRGATEFFCYRESAGERLRFILARDQTGHVDAVFDACRQCYAFHKGYTVSGKYIICRLCGNRYRIKSMEKGKASCVPVPLRVELNGDQVEIKAADLKKGSGLF